MDLDDKLWSEVVDKIEVNDDATFLEFGVASGNTMCALLNNLIKKNIKPKMVIGYDAFEGLPKEQDGVPVHESWTKGAFNLKSEIQTNSKIISTLKDPKLDPLLVLQTRFKEYEKHDIVVNLVKGWYSDTLLENITVRPACFIHIDCDLYISSIQVLEWLARYKLFAPNCLVRYDDWFIPGQSVYEAGESKAHKEICQKYDLNFEYVANNGDAAVLYRYNPS